MYQETIDKCKKAYKEHNLNLANQYWEKLYEILDSKLENANNLEDRQNVYDEHFKYMQQFTNEEVYKITDYAKEKAYRQMLKDQFENISLSGFNNEENLSLLDEFCDFYEWLPIKTDSGFNILDLQLNRLVEDEDYKTFTELVNRIVGRALDYFMNEEDWEDNEETINYGLNLYNIAKKYTNGTKWDEDWLDSIKKELKS